MDPVKQAVEDRRPYVKMVPLPPLGASVMGPSLPEIELQQRYTGGVTQAVSMGWKEAFNSDNSIGQRLIYGGLALAGTPNMMVESMLYAPLNIGPAARETGQYVARAGLQTDPAERNMDILRSVGTGAEAFSNVGAWLVGPRPQVTNQSSAELAAVRATYALEAEASQASRLSATFQGRTIEPQLSGQTLFHGNSMSWDDIVAAGGLPEKGANVDMLNHLNGGTNSAFRGTNRYANSPIRDGNGPVEWAGQGGTVVQIDGRMTPNYDANALTAGRIQRFDGRFVDHVWAGEAEFPIHARVPIESITHYGTVVQDRAGRPLIERWIANPSYKKTPQ